MFFLKNFSTQVMNKINYSITQSIKHSINTFLWRRQTRKDTSGDFFAPLMRRQKQQKATAARLLLSVCMHTAISYLAIFSRLSHLTLMSPLSPRHLSLRLLSRPVWEPLVFSYQGHFVAATRATAVACRCCRKPLSEYSHCNPIKLSFRFCRCRCCCFLSPPVWWGISINL